VNDDTEIISEIAAIRSDLEDILEANSGLQDALQTLKLRLMSELAEHCKDNPWDLVEYCIGNFMNKYETEICGDVPLLNSERIAIFRFVSALLEDDNFLAALLAALRVRV